MIDEGWYGALGKERALCYNGGMPDRKYRQRGYMDNERREDDRTRAPQGPRPKPEGPRGRGLGAPTSTVRRCRVCGTQQAVVGTVAIDATCSRCGADLHSCSQCAHFDASRPNQCRKPVPERIENKVKRNSCELYAPATVQEFATETPVARDDPRDAFDALFKKK